MYKKAKLKYEIINQLFSSSFILKFVYIVVLNFAQHFSLISECVVISNMNVTLIV